MKTPTLIHTLMAGLVMILGSGMLSASAVAGPPEFYEIATMPSMYERIPAVWEHLVVEGKIEWTSEDEAGTEPNDDWEHAYTVSSRIQINGHVNETTDMNDYFKVELTEQSSLFVRLTWSGSAWLNVYIYDANIQPITYLNENTPSPKVLSIWQYNAGTYYIRVRAAAGASGYQLRFAIAGQIAEPQNDTLEDTDLTVSAFKTPRTSVICSSADPVDYAILSIPAGGESATVTLDWFGSLDGNLDFDIYNEEGVKLITVANSSTFESNYSQNVPAGIYYIAVRSVNGRAMYQLMVDSEVELFIEIPIFEVEVAPWHPPFPMIDLDYIEPIIIDQPVVVR